MKKWLLLPFVIAILVIGFLYYWANQPVKTTIEPAAIKTGSRAFDEQPLIIDNEYFATVLPAGYRISDQSYPDIGRQKLQLVAISTSSPSIQVAFTVGEYSQEGLEGVSDYTFRLKNPDIYTQNNWTELGVAAKTFVKNDGKETTTFIEKDNHYGVVSVTGATSSQKLKTLSIDILKKWDWKS